MKKYIYCKRDKKLNFYDVPNYDDHDPDQYTKVVARGCGQLRDENTILRLKDSECYCLGTFDDESCVFDLYDKPIKLFDFSDFLGGLDE